MRKEPASSKEEAGSGKVIWRRPTLPPLIRGSTIGAGGLNCRVRDGNGCFPSAIATRTLFRRASGRRVSRVGTDRVPSDARRATRDTLTHDAMRGTFKTAERMDL